MAGGVVCFAQDYAVFSGTMGEMHAKKVAKVAEFAEKSQLPLIGIWDRRRPEGSRRG